jgi:uncharacterized protein YukE
MTDKEAMKQMVAEIDALPDGLEGYFSDSFSDALSKLRQAIREHAMCEVQRLGQEIEQEPVPTLENLEQEIYQNTRNFVSRDVMEWMLRRYYTHPPQHTEQNFCPRCEKRTPDLTHIHTCTPPKEGT